MLALQEESPLGNMFSISIGNILPGTVNIKTTYINPIRKDEQFRSWIKVDKDIMPKNSVDSSISMKFEGVNPKSVTLNGHQLDPGNNGIYKRKGKTAKEDMLFYIDEDIGEPVLLKNKDDYSCHVMVNFVPIFHVKPDYAVYQSDIVFLVDRSGSMYYTIEETKKALKLMIPAIPNTCKFNIVSFGSTFSKLYETSQHLTETTFQQAISHVNLMTADMGGTNIYGPLSSIFNEPVDIDYPRVLIVITDGRVFSI